MNLDFSVVFIVAGLVTGSIWAIDAWLLAPRRAAAAGSGDISAAAKEPLLVEYARSFFPIILVVFLFRSFAYEPFRIPSSSMLPTLQTGVLILVNKFDYGLRLPIVGTTLLPLGEPRRGDVVVFRLPSEPNKHYIKRLVGLPGDRIRYEDKQLIINGEPVDLAANGYYRIGNSIKARQVTEMLGDKQHEILVLPQRRDAPLELVVPEGHYFMMGDNRDNSSDSRVWGQVPERDIVGKAFAVWMHWGEFFSVPSFDRVGLIE